MLRNIALTLSMANLCMMNMWHSLLYRAPSSSSNDYFLKSFPYRIAVGAAVLDVALLGALLLPFIVLAGRRKSTGTALSRLVVLALLFFAVDRILLFGRSFLVGSSLTASDAGLVFIIALVTLLILYVLWDRKPGVGETLCNALLVFSPFVLITFGHAAWHAVQGNGVFTDKPLAPLIQTTAASPRVSGSFLTKWISVQHL